jgi:uncharacterized iron-regulated protein
MRRPESRLSPRTAFLAALLAAPLAACAGATATRSPDHGATAAGPAVDLDEHALFTGDGEPAALADLLAAVAAVDLVGFGELHNHAVGSRVELEVLQGMAAQGRPVALAMEFFEADEQAALDRYLAGEIDEATFRAETRRDAHYESSHRPLIEFARAHKIPVIAANAPRRLVVAYRKAGGTDYQGYLAGLSPEDRAFLPRTSVPPDDDFKVRFMTLMGPKRGPAFFPSMCLWNDAMAESIADFRATHPDHRVLLIVGSFHVARHLGVVTKFKERRADDTVRVLVMSPAEGAMGFAGDDHGEGDFVLRVRVPKG